VKDAIPETVTFVMSTCKGLKADGKPCSRTVSKKPNTNSDYCWQHQSQVAPTTIAKTPTPTQPIAQKSPKIDEDEDEDGVSPIENGDYSIETITPIVIGEIDKDKLKGIIWNESNIWDLLEYLHKYDDIEIGADDDEYEAKLAPLIKELLKLKLIYKDGDKQSYRELVKTPGLISKSEYGMGQSIKDSIKQSGPKKKGVHKIVFTDTEFPVDHDTGKYLPF
jgi:hypothetical protein